jgi:hypothetical protein
VLGVLANDGDHDLVPLKIGAKDLTSLPLGSSEKAEAGRTSGGTLGADVLMDVVVQ